tara:strand:+ start:3587 stop:4288 length:702 start_codon:yes stop_codon:yes gene_type:complete
MIVGSGQIATAFKSCSPCNSVVFASGVANSSCTDTLEFERERALLEYSLETLADRKFVYFSSCALSANNYRLNSYYKHKLQMEKLITSRTDNYYIFRIPQLFGCMKKHSTLINYLFNVINESKSFNVYSGANRYVIELNDVVTLVNSYVNNSTPSITVNLANTYRYSVLELVEAFEEILDVKAQYDLIPGVDSYELNLEELQEHIETYKIDIELGKSYFKRKLTPKIRSCEVN